MYTYGGFVLMFGKTNSVSGLKKKSVLIKKKRIWHISINFSGDRCKLTVFFA